jgi:hypothetical protein
MTDIILSLAVTGWANIRPKNTPDNLFANLRPMNDICIAAEKIGFIGTERYD